MNNNVIPLKEGDKALVFRYDNTTNYEQIICIGEVLGVYQNLELCLVVELYEGKYKDPKPGYTAKYNDKTDKKGIYAISFEDWIKKVKSHPDDYECEIKETIEYFEELIRKNYQQCIDISKEYEGKLKTMNNKIDDYSKYIKILESV